MTKQLNNKEWFYALKQFLEFIKEVLKLLRNVIVVLRHKKIFSAFLSIVILNSKQIILFYVVPSF